MDVIRPLAEITLADIEQVGGKAAHLGAMLRAGFPVPPGFVITVDAFTDHFGPTTDPLVRPPPPRLEPDLMAAVVEAIREHLGDEPEFAVRSSSTHEDADEASFAGQHATYYFIPPRRIDQAILDCWMSLWSDAALAYRRAGVAEIASGEPVRMAVIVQAMVGATRSGVAFSRDPVDPAGTDCVIEATWGLGAALVDGRVTPDHIRVGEDGRVSTYTVHAKQFLVTPNPANPDGKRLDEVPRHQVNAPALSEAEAEHIAHLASQIETLFEGPQDIEWAYAGETPWVLQARPITTVPRARSNRRLVLFKPLAENFTEPLTPMSADLYAEVLPRIGEIVDGRFYIDIDQLRKLVPFRVSDAELVDLALLRRTPEKLEVDWRRLLALLAFGKLVFLIDGATWLRAAWLTESGLARYAELAAALTASPRYDARTTLRRLFLGTHPLEPLGHHMVMVNITAGRYFLHLGLLRALVKRIAPDFTEAELNKTFHGNKQMHSVDLLAEIDHLAGLLKTARDQPDDEHTAGIEAVLRGDASLLPTGHPFTIAVEQFLERYGHRGSREMELAAPRWREEVQPFLRMVAGHAMPQSDRHGSHLAALDKLHQRLRPWQRRIVNALIDRVARFTALRENTRHYHILGFAATRTKLLQLERELLFNERLKARGDIFFLTFDEASALASGGLDPQSAHVRVRRRRRHWARLCRLPIEETINIETPRAAPATEGALRGQCACPGQVEGVARVATSLHDAGELAPGEILVAPYTDPSWTPLFPRAKGVVVEVGSYLSHAGTIARELHLPCIVDVPGCTTLITSGQRVRLDAERGTVEVVA